MALLDTSFITDIHTLRLEARDSEKASKCKLKAERDMKAAARGAGVASGQIPVDVDGKATSEVLQKYGEYKYLFYTHEAVAGGVSNDDTYKDEMEKFEEKAEKTEKRVTCFTITGNETVKQANRIRSKPIW